MQRRTLIAIAALAAAVGAPALAQSDIKIAHIYSKTGPLEAYGKQTQAGLMMGLNYATGGTMAVNGRKITVIEKDDQGKPDLGKSLLAAAYSDDKVDLAVGPTSSGVALAMLPVAEEYKKILLVEPAVADSITGDKWNKYIFRTGRNSSQDAISNAVAIDKAGTSIVDKLKGEPGRKVVMVIWAGGTPPFGALAAQELNKRFNIDVATGGNILPAMASYKAFPGMEGATYYYFGIPKNPVNEAMVAAHYKEYKTPPDFFTAGGFSAAMAIVTALKKTNGDTNTNKLISTMEGMSFDTPKGKMTFRKEDHQAMQSMYHFKIKADPAFTWGVPELVREIKPEEMHVPIRNKR